jgi:hypothetical protein
MTDDKFRIHLLSGNGMRRNQQDADGPKDQTQLLKYAIFYLVVAAILLVANQAAKDPMARANQVRPASNLHIDLSVARKFEKNSTGGNAAGRTGAFVVLFRLTNQGNQPIFYSVSPSTNRPIGQIVYRIAPGADWKPLSTPAIPPSMRDEQNVKDRLAWVEMPPGGWADGEYEDPGFPAGDHAFALDVKVATDGKVSPFLSRAYPVHSN